MGVQDAETPRFRDNLHVQHGNIVIHPQRPHLAPTKYSCTHFCYRRSRPQGHSAAGMIMSVNNSEYATLNRTRDLTTCSALPEPT